jgi:hypothetical protein
MQQAPGGAGLAPAVQSSQRCRLRPHWLAGWPERVVLVALPWDEHFVGSDDEPHMLYRQDDGVVTHQQLARLCTPRMGGWEVGGQVAGWWVGGRLPGPRFRQARMRRAVQQYKQQQGAAGCSPARSTHCAHAPDPRRLKSSRRMSRMGMPSPSCTMSERLSACRKERLAESSITIQALRLHSSSSRRWRGVKGGTQARAQGRWGWGIRGQQRRESWAGTAGGCRLQRGRGSPCA